MRREEAYKKFRKKHEAELDASKHGLRFEERGIRIAFYEGFKAGKAKVRKNK